MIIGCDIDDTILNLIEPWIDKYNSDFEDSLSKEDVIDWNLDQFVKPECGKRIYNYINTPKIFEKAKPIDGSLNAISYLMAKGHRIVYITANSPSNIKQQWLMENGFWNGEKNFILSYDKSLITTDILIDDKLENCENAQGIGILFTQPHNKSFDWYPRANNWQEVIDIIEGKANYE